LVGRDSSQCVSKPVIPWRLCLVQASLMEFCWAFHAPTRHDQSKDDRAHPSFHCI
jgi:hypothetical protein